MPGMPNGKPAGTRCLHLDTGNLCRLFGLPSRPAFCVGLRPEPDMCGANASDALTRLTVLEAATRPTAA
jgi:hypothetical protein